MDDYFNEDDLINDYIANAEEEEPPFEDEYMEPEDEPDNNKEATTATATGAGAETNDNAAGNAGIGNETVTKPSASSDNTVSVPQLISTSPAAKSTSYRNNHSTNSNNDLYGFERYTGLSSWRSNNNNGSNNNGNIAGGETHGATTMEATGWKKKESKIPPKGGGESDDDSFDCETDFLQSRKRTNNDHKTNIGANQGGSHGASAGRGGEAQLVRFRERYEQIVLGRSWGKTGRGNNNDDIRCVYANRNLPELGEDSMPITLADGTRTFVKRATNHDHGGGTSNNNEKTTKNDEEEECLLGLPMTELVRRADILQKRAIQRKIEREARYGKSSNANADEDGAEKDETMEDDGSQPRSDNIERARLQVAVDQSAAEAGLGHATNNNATLDEISFQQQSQALKKKRQRHKMMQLQQRLWVDKHAPTSISHLLSDEHTNREVIRALRAWDPYVFKKDAPARPVSAYPSKWEEGKNNGRFGGKNNDNYGKQDKKDNDNSNNLDGGKADRVDIRPNETSRVILLSGPPGVGKSTLAHIVCKHAGYRPIEVNASDERSASALTERVTRAMESTTLNLEKKSNDHVGEAGGKKRGGKPNCIILDEVDGADAKSAIAALVAIIRADISPPGSSKGKKNSTYLRRPIILICNHKYAPALRPILPYARQFDVQPPNPERLTGRLRAVLAAERMTVVAGGMLLHRLVTATGGDVRSCLFALQFASTRARELAVKKREREGLVTKQGDSTSFMVDISSTLQSALGDTGNGMKDMQSDVSSTVSTVFRKPKTQNKRQKTLNGSSKSSVAPKGVDVVLKAVDHFGDNSKTLDCLFMNVNRVSYVDPTFDRCCSAFEWLSEADTYRSHKSNVAMNNSAEHYSMQKFYIPSAAGAIHLLCCVETRPDLTFSTRPLSDVHYQNQANVSLVHRFVEGLAPRARRGVGGGTDTVVSDVIPYGLWLLSAGDGKHSLSKPVSSVDYLGAEEKIAFSEHVAMLRALGLTYVKDEKTFDYNDPDATTENVRLEPEIDKLVKYDGMDGYSGRQDIPPLLKELLAHGATVAALRERESEAQIAQQEAVAVAGEKARQKSKRDISPKVKVPEKPPKITPKKQPTKAGSNSSAAKNFLGFRAAKAKEAKTAQRAARVGFDRSKKVKLSNTGSGVGITKVIRFKYQKGFTQAVRAPCQLEDLL